MDWEGLTKTWCAFGLWLGLADPTLYIFSMHVVYLHHMRPHKEHKDSRILCVGFGFMGCQPNTIVSWILWHIIIKYDGFCGNSITKKDQRILCQHWLALLCERLIVLVAYSREWMHVNYQNDKEDPEFSIWLSWEKNLSRQNNAKSKLLCSIMKINAFASFDRDKLLLVILYQR